MRGNLIKLLVAVLAVVVAGLLHWADLQPLENIDHAALDLRYRFRPAVEQKDIVIIGVSDSSLNLRELSDRELEFEPILREMQQPFPWDRSVWADILERLMDAGASMVIFDFFFSNPTDGDLKLAEAIERHQDKVVLGSYFFSEQDQQGNRVSYQEPVDDLIPWEGPEIIGFTNVYADRDGTIRRTRHATSLMAELSGIQPGAESAKEDDWLADQEPLLSLSGLAWLKLNQQAPKDAPLDWYDYRLIDYTGPRGWFDSFAVESFLYEGSRGRQLLENGYFQDKIVIVGPLAIIFQDMKTTPLDVMVPGPEIHAHILADLMAGRPLQEAGLATQLSIAALLALLVTAGSIYIQSALRKLIGIILLVLAFAVLSQWYFESRFWIIPVFIPLFSLILPGIFGLAWDFIQEQYQRRRLRGVLDRYVSPNVASVIIQQDRESFAAAMKGEKRPICVLFSDIRSFTSWSENTDPTDLVDQLNEYFGGTVEAILKQEGTLQKYIGDALMAVWGDTHTHGPEEDARRSLRAALHMFDALDEMNKKWQANPQRTPLKIGVGLNQGEAVVGNLGHPQRMEFTVLGDAVNFAARLESATKQFDQSILISDSIRDLAGDEFVFRQIDKLQVKGKKKPVEVYTVLSEKSQAQAPDWLHSYHEAIHLFRDRKFEEAQSLLNKLANTSLKDDFLCQHYLRRCSACLLKPPTENWDGSYELKE